MGDSNSFQSVVHLLKEINTILQTPITAPRNPAPVKGRLMVTKPPKQAKQGQTKAQLPTKAHEIVLEGVVQSGGTTEFSVNGQDFEVGGDTWMFGDLAIGVKATVHCAMRANGVKFAKKIVVKP